MTEAQMHETVTRDIQELRKLVKRCEETVTTRCSHDEVETWLDRKINSLSDTVFQRQEDTLRRLMVRQQDSLAVLQERNGESWRKSLGHIAEIEEKCILRKDLPILLSQQSQARVESAEASSGVSREELRELNKRLDAVEQKRVMSSIDDDASFCVFRAQVDARLEGLATVVQGVSAVMCELESSKLERDAEAKRLEIWADEVTIQFRQSAGKLLSKVEDYVSNFEKESDRKLQLKIEQAEAKTKTMTQSCEQQVHDTLLEHTTQMKAYVAGEVTPAMERMTKLEENVVACEDMVDSKVRDVKDTAAEVHKSMASLSERVDDDLKASKFDAAKLEEDLRNHQEDLRQAINTVDDALTRLDTATRDEAVELQAFSNDLAVRIDSVENGLRGEYARIDSNADACDRLQAIVDELTSAQGRANVPALPRFDAPPRSLTPREERTPDCSARQGPSYTPLCSARKESDQYLGLTSMGSGRYSARKSKSPLVMSARTPPWDSAREQYSARTPRDPSGAGERPPVPSVKEDWKKSKTGKNPDKSKGKRAKDEDTLPSWDTPAKQTTAKFDDDDDASSWDSPVKSQAKVKGKDADSEWDSPGRSEPKVPKQADADSSWDSPGRSGPKEGKQADADSSWDSPGRSEPKARKQADADSSWDSPGRSEPKVRTQADADSSWDSPGRSEPKVPKQADADSSWDSPGRSEPKARKQADADSSWDSPGRSEPKVHKQADADSSWDSPGRSGPQGNTGDGNSAWDSPRKSEPKGKQADADSSWDSPTSNARAAKTKDGDGQSSWDSPVHSKGAALPLPESPAAKPASKAAPAGGSAHHADSSFGSLTDILGDRGKLMGDLGFSDDDA